MISDYMKTPEELDAIAAKEAVGMKSHEVFKVIKDRFHRYDNICIDEFTYGSWRIDLIMIDTDKRWIRGFEIKVSRADFLQDEKWEDYSHFCSSLSVVCPWGLIQRDEIRKPFGLLWVSRNGAYQWVRRPKNFQRREALAWTYTYFRVLETEFKRIWWMDKK